MASKQITPDPSETRPEFLVDASDQSTLGPGSYFNGKMRELVENFVPPQYRETSLYHVNEWTGLFFITTHEPPDEDDEGEDSLEVGLGLWLNTIHDYLATNGSIALHGIALPNADIENEDSLLDQIFTSGGKTEDEIEHIFTWETFIGVIGERRFVIEHRTPTELFFFRDEYGLVFTGPMTFHEPLPAFDD